MTFPNMDTNALFDGQLDSCSEERDFGPLSRRQCFGTDSAAEPNLGQFRSSYVVCVFQKRHNKQSVIYI